MHASDFIVDRWREVAAIPENGFRGMTELHKGDRCWQLGGTGDAIREQLLEHVIHVLADEAASVVVSVDRVSLVDQALHHGDGCMVGEPDQGATTAGGRLLNPDLAVRNSDCRAALGAVHVERDVVEIGASHAPAVRLADESDQAA